MTVYERKDSRFYWAAIRNRAGRRIQINTRIPVPAPNSPTHERRKLRGEAESVARMAQAKITIDDNGLGGKPARSVREHLTWYRDHVTIHKRGAAAERYMIGTLIDGLGDVMLAELTRPRVQEWITARAADVKASSIARELVVLKHAIKTATPDYLATSPIAGMVGPRCDNVDIFVLSPADEAKLVAALDHDDDKAIVTMAIDTLIRFASLVEIRRADLRDGFAQVLNSKNGTAYRVPLSTRVRAAIDALPADPDGSDRVFWRRQRQAYWTRFQDVLATACGKAGIPYGRKVGGLTFHALRHTGATRLILGGVDVRTVMAIGGWTSFRSMTRYLHPAESITRAAVEIIGNPTGRHLFAVPSKAAKATPAKARPAAGRRHPKAVGE